MTHAHPASVVQRIRKVVGAHPAEEDDRELLRRFTSGNDQDAFAALVRRHGPMVLGVCRRILHHAEDAEDAFQATFLVLARKAGLLRDAGSLASWLHGVASRSALALRRAAGRRQAHEARARTRTVPDAVGEASWKEVQRALDEEVQRLPERLRAPFVLCHLEGASRAEAARQLEVKEGTIGSGLTQARACLRERLARRGISLSAVLAGLAVTEEKLALKPDLVSSTTRAAGTLAAEGGGLPGVSAAVREVVAREGRTVVASKIQVGALLGLAAGLLVAGTLAFRGADAGQQAKAEGGRGAPALAPPSSDRHGDPLPPGAVTRLGTVRFNHGDGLNALFFTPAGKEILSVGGGPLVVWDADTGKELQRCATGPSSWDEQTVLSRDGKRLHFLKQELPTDTLRVWDLGSMSEASRTPLPVRRPESSIDRRNALSPDGRLAAVNTAKGVRIFATATGRELCQLPLPEAKVRALCFAGPDHLVSADSRQRIEVFEAATGKRVRQFPHGAPARVLAASADGTRLATLEHHTHAIDRLLERDVVRVWDLTRGTRLHVFPARPQRWYMGVTFSPDGKHLFAPSSGRDGYVVAVWNVETGRLVRELKGAIGKALAVSPNGRRLAEGSLLGKFELWDVATGRRRSPEDGSHALASAVFLSPTGERAYTIGHSSISTWDGTTGQRLRSLPLSPFLYSNPRRSHSPDGRFALTFAKTSDKLHLLLWDVAGGRLLHRLEPPGASLPVATAFAPDSSVLATLLPGKETLVRLWDVRTGKERHSFLVSRASWPGQLFFSADGQTLFVVGRRVVGFETATGKERFSWRLEPMGGAGEGPVPVAGPAVAPSEPFSWRTVTIAPAGDLAACIRSGGAGGGHFGGCVARQVVVCAARTGKVLRTWGYAGKWSRTFECLEFSPDGRVLASSDGASIHLWEVATGKKICTLQGHRGEIRSLAFSANHQRLASASHDSTVLLWDLTDPEGIRVAPGKDPVEKDLARWWTDLASPDASKAHAAIWQLARNPQVSVPFLRGRLRAITEAEVQKAAPLVAALDSENFAVREKASRELEKLGRAAVPALRRGLRENPSAEARRRIGRLLARFEDLPARGEPLRTVRALAVLEYASTPEARKILEVLAGGVPEDEVARTARAALRRSERLADNPH